MAEKITREQYENLKSSRIDNSEVFFDWNLSTRVSVDKMKEFSQLFGNNKERFRKQWGRQSCTWDGWVRWWIWKVPLPSGNLYAMVSSEGTVYEIEYEHFEDFEKICSEAITLLRKVFGIDREV